MDGFTQSDKVIVMAATNRPDVLDAALVRPGRFDRSVSIHLPTKEERLAILKIHTRSMPLDDDIVFDVVARRTVEFSGAQLQSVANEAAILSARDNKKTVSQEYFLEAIEKVAFGTQKKSKKITDDDRKLVAYHEAGHALLASVLPHANPVQKITIIPRGPAGGYVIHYPENDNTISNRVKEKFLADITVALGGYVTEKMIFSQVSTGPSSDIEQATAIAKNMVTRWGMSEKVGPVLVDSHGEIPQIQSNSLQDLVDEEVRAIVLSCQKNAEKLVRKHKNVLDVIVEKLLEVKTMERDEFEALIKTAGIKIQKV